MEVDLEALFIPLSFFFLIGFVIQQARRRNEHETQRRFELGVRTLERFGEPEALEKFLSSPAGQDFLRLLDSGEPPLARRILRSVQAGIVLVAVGLGFTFLSRTGEGDPEMIVPGALFLCVGLALLAGAGVARALAQRWDILGDARGAARRPMPYREPPSP
ncbi:MAG: hypothetical protein R3B09_30790 [Nannocystaceae bacterium]